LAIADLMFRVFWIVVPCSYVEVNLTTRCYIPEDSKHNIRRRENLKSYSVRYV
jgi:hypothetical protein